MKKFPLPADRRHIRLSGPRGSGLTTMARIIGIDAAGRLDSVIVVGWDRFDALAHASRGKIPHFSAREGRLGWHCDLLIVTAHAVRNWGQCDPDWLNSIEPGGRLLTIHQGN